MSNQQQVQQLTLGQIAQKLKDSTQTCEICNKFFKKLSHFNRHMTERHTSKRDYTCKQENCNKTFKRESHLKRHMISHTNIKKFKCAHCCMAFGYKYHLDRHVKVIHLSERIKCVSCELEFKKKKAYRDHIKNVHTAKLKKDASGVEESKAHDHTTTKIGLEQSMKNQDIYDSQSESEKEDCAKSERLLYRCQFFDCFSAFERLSDFKRHLSRIHSDNKEQE